MDISKEKLDWLKSIGAKKFEHPMTWDDGKDLYSDEYLAETPLEVLKARHIEEEPETVHYNCPCGKTEHYADAKYCTSCGRKIER